MFSLDVINVNLGHILIYMNVRKGVIGITFSRGKMMIAPLNLARASC